MGCYINTAKDGNYLPAKNKADALINEGATMLERAPTQRVDDLVCVVENGAFDAAAYCFDDAEFRAFAHNDGRRKTWLIVANAAERSGYKPTMESRKGY